MRYKSISGRVKISDEHVGRMRGMFISSGDNDDYAGCKFTVYMFSHSLNIKLPSLIKPLKHEHSFVATWKEGKPTQSYDEFLEKKYGWLYLDNHLSIMYGLQTDMAADAYRDKLKNRSWSCFLPWLEWKFTRHTVYESGQSVYAEDTHGKHIDYELIEDCPKYRFELEDYDGAELYADCYIEERVWNRGVKLFSWLKYFCKDQVRLSLDISFSEETGKRKQTHKGGTTGTSIELTDKYESATSAMIRYCKEHNMKYIQQVEFLGGQKVINCDDNCEKL